MTSSLSDRSVLRTGAAMAVMRTLETAVQLEGSSGAGVQL